MTRHSWAALVVWFALAGSFLLADPPQPANNLETTLALQKAMYLARLHLRYDEPRKAVDVLEQHLAKVNGNQGYLELLRDAYRALIKEMALTGQADDAQRYLQRLIILDPAAADDPSLRPAQTPKLQPVTPRDEKPDTPLPNFSKTHAPPARPPQIDVLSTTKGPTVRGMREMPQDDPFDLVHRRVAAPKSTKNDLGDLLARAHQEFDGARYQDARYYYEQVVKLDQTSLPQVSDRLAYCILDSVVQQLNDNAQVPLPDLGRQVGRALALSPKLASHGSMLLQEIEQRGRRPGGAAPDVAADPPLGLRHYDGKNESGWQVTETRSFRIYHNQKRELVERIALIAERTRVAMARKWFGHDGGDWNPKCELVVHGSAAEYARMTQQPISSPGHTRIENDRTTFQVIRRQIYLHVEAMGFLEAVLPHETTHVVLAGNFGSHQVPRWADEGVAVLTEPLEKIEQHRRNLLRGRREGLLLPLRDLLHVQNYPDPRQIGAFYAQSVMLVEFLTSVRGPAAFTEFVRDGLNEGYEPALRKHYGWTFSQLQSQWDREVLGEMQKLASGR